MAESAGWMDQPPVFVAQSRRVLVQQPRLVAGVTDEGGEPMSGPLQFLTVPKIAEHTAGAFVSVVGSLSECEACINDPHPGLQWIEVRGQMGNEEFWAFAAQGVDGIPMDVRLDDPANEFGNLYRLVDVARARSVRVVIPVRPGFLKAFRLATSLALPISLVPGQPGPDVIDELGAALDLYLHDPMVEAPVEFFHSTLATIREPNPPTLWTILEEDPDVFQRAPLPPGDAATFIEDHLTELVASGAECAGCPWIAPCAGYFKRPDPGYRCDGVKDLFSRIRSAADEMAVALEGSKSS